MDSNEMESEADTEEPWFITVCIFCKKNLTTRSEINVSKLLQCLHAICNNCYASWDEYGNYMIPFYYNLVALLIKN